MEGLLPPTTRGCGQLFLQRFMVQQANDSEIVREQMQAYCILVTYRYVSLYMYMYYKLYTLHYITFHFITLHYITLYTHVSIIVYIDIIYIYVSHNICTLYHIISTYTYIILYTHMCNSVCVIIYMCR